MTYHPTTMSRADLGDIVTRLEEERTRRLDLVVPAGAINVTGDLLSVRLDEPVLTEYGVVSSLDIEPSDGMIGDLAAKLDVPVKYLRTLFEHADIEGPEGGIRTSAYLTTEHVLGHGLDLHDAESFLLRTFVDDDGPAFGRAFLSNKYGVLDSLDYLLTILDSLKDVAPNAQVVSADLSPRAMRVRVTDPTITALAPALLNGYRSPYGGAEGTDNPVIFGGIEFGNSETGDGSSYIVPRFVVEVCSNGMTMTTDALRKTHLGGRMDDGVIQWSEQTSHRELSFISSQVGDAVRTYMNTDYMEAKIAEITEAAGHEVEHPEKAIEVVAKKLRFTDTEQAGILSHFIKGGQSTTGGVMQAITSYAQTVDGDRQHELEAVAVEAMAVAR